MKTCMSDLSPKTSLWDRIHKEKKTKTFALTHQLIGVYVTLIQHQARWVTSARETDQRGELLTVMPRRRLCLGTLVFLPGRGCDGTSGRPLYCYQLIWVFMRVIMQQKVLDRPLFNLRERHENRVRRWKKNDVDRGSVLSKDCCHNNTEIGPSSPNSEDGHWD